MLREEKSYVILKEEKLYVILREEKLYVILREGTTEGSFPPGSSKTPPFGDYNVLQVTQVIPQSDRLIMQNP